METTKKKRSEKSMTECRIALKEWAVVCEAIATGRQQVLFRKGGIHEGSRGFQIEHNEFWLFPTGFHQSLDGVQKPFQQAARSVLDVSPAPGRLRIQHFCQLQGIAWCDSEAKLDELLPFQVLTRESLLTRFHYRRPGLFILLVTCASLPEPVTIPADPIYDGCHSWVELQQPIFTDSLIHLPENAQELRQREHLLEMFPDLAKPVPLTS